MNNILRLARKRLWYFRFIHLLTALLVAAVVVAALLYQGSLMALGSGFKGKLERPQLPGDVAILQMGYRPHPGLTNARQPVLHLALRSIYTDYGQQSLAAVISSNHKDWPTPSPGEIYLPASLQEQMPAATGDYIMLSYFGGGVLQTELCVGGFYENGGYLAALLVNESWFDGWLGLNAATETISVYRQTDYDELYKGMRRLSGQADKAIRLSQSLQDADTLVNTMYGASKGIMVLVIVFLAIGIGTFALLIFLDSRQELAILKASGFKPKQAGALLGLEFLFSSFVGLLLGYGGFLFFNNVSGSTLEANTPLMVMGAAVLITAFVFALLAPVRLAVVATVNELLLRRPILMWTQRATPLASRRPALDDLISRGFTCFILEHDEKDFLGTVVPQVGTQVRRGELLAWQPILFGIGEKRYLAPFDGVVEAIDGSRGVLALSTSGREEGAIDNPLQ